MEVTRLQGKTHIGSYVVNVTVDGGKIKSIDISGKANKSIEYLCKILGNSRTSHCKDGIDAIKLTMIKKLEYAGEIK